VGGDEQIVAGFYFALGDFPESFDLVFPQRSTGMDQKKLAAGGTGNTLSKKVRLSKKVSKINSISSLKMAVVILAVFYAQFIDV